MAGDQEGGGIADLGEVPGLFWPIASAMCGIAGIVRFRGPFLRKESAVPRLLESLRHRGPDDSGFFSWCGETCCVHLVHTRLSIIDLSPAGHQPMVSDDGALCLVFNGEIYNYRELRQELQSKGYGFRSTSDSEVILRLYEDRQEKALDDLRGMFAMALWNRRNQSLLLARDRLGIKPLYYSWEGSTLIFSSEVKAMRQAGFAEGGLDPEAVMLYLKFGSIPSPKTICRGIQSLNPGQYVMLEDGRLRTGQYWSLSQSLASADVEEASHEETVASVREALLDSVRRHFIADVPVGVFLSGGVDSSSLVSLATRAGFNRIKTISAVYDGDALDESRFARQVARTYGTEHTEMRISMEDLESLFDPFFRAMDQPTYDGLNTYLVSWTARKAGLKVCLSGLGGDELFGGYPSFQRVPKLHKALKIVGPLVSGLWAPACLVPRDKWQRVGDMCRPVSLEKVYLSYKSMFCNRTLSDLVGSPVEGYNFVQYLPEGISSVQDPRRKVSAFELSFYMANQLLRDSDVFGMSHPVEIRVPLVDHILLERLARIPEGLLFGGRFNKQLLIDAVGDLPGAVYNRPKMCFTLPFERWLRGYLMDHVTQAVEKCGLFHQPAARRILDGYRMGRLHWSRVWVLYVLSRYA